jgi:hypothetical protein
MFENEFKGLYMNIIIFVKDTSERCRLLNVADNQKHVAITVKGVAHLASWLELKRYTFELVVTDCVEKIKDSCGSVEVIDIQEFLKRFSVTSA